MMRALFKMILQDGHIHGDLHPGNIFVCENGEIVLIDFGLCGKLLPRQREGILELLIGVAKEDYEKVARSFFDMGEKVPGVRYDFSAFESDVVSIMEKHILGKTLQEVDVQSYFSDLVAGAIRHQIRMPATYTMVFKALMTVEGIGKVLAPEINFLDETRPFIQEILVERYSPKRILREASDVLGNFGRLTRQFTQSAPQILRDMEQGNTGVKSEILGLKKIAEEQRRLLKMQTRGNLTAAAFVAGAILYDIPGTTILGMSIPTFIMFIVGGLTGFPLIFSMLRRG
jgi:ubiquinone biosynthesis protein